MTAFDPNRCSCIDKVGNTTIWRGNTPLNKEGYFAYHEMAIALDLDPETLLVDVSLIDNIRGGEREQWLAEIGAYGVKVTSFPKGSNIPPQFNQKDWNPACLLGSSLKLPTGDALGHLVWWQIEGGHDEIVLGPEVRSYNFIGFLEYLGTLRLMENAVLYIHCMNGTDRTGATVAAYAMRYLGMDLDMAMLFASSVPQAGIMSEDYKQLVAAYAQWLSNQTFGSL